MSRKPRGLPLDIFREVVPINVNSSAGPPDSVYRAASTETQGLHQNRVPLSKLKRTSCFLLLVLMNTDPGDDAFRTHMFLECQREWMVASQSIELALLLALGELC